MYCWEAILRALAAENVEYVFGLPGADAFYDFLGDRPEIQPILVREESSGAFMAMGYARASGKVGVCYASAGPGVANLIPGILEAQSACLPVIALGGASSQENAGMGAFQEADQISWMRPITKWWERITAPERVPWVMNRAFFLARTGKPGPIYIEIPKDIGTRRGKVPEYRPALTPPRWSADPKALEGAAALLIEAKQPVLVAGGGALSAGAFEELKELAELLSAPVLTTPCGRGIIAEDHPLAFGQVGLYFNPLGEKIYGKADLLLTIGSRNEDFQSGRQGFFPPGAKYLQIDIDPFEIGRNWIPEVAMVGDAKLILADLVARVKADLKGKKRGEERMAKLLEAKTEYEAQVRRECHDDSVPLKTKRIVRELNEVFGKGTLLVQENGSQDLWSYYSPYYKVFDGDRCVAPGEQTCMGMAVAAAIGAKLARPEKKVVCTTGDGAFQMFMKELPTAVQYRAPVTYVVLNNFSLGWTRFSQNKRKGRSIATEFTAQPDFVKVAQACQCHGERIESPGEIRPALERARRANEEGKTAVLEFIVDGWDFAPGFHRFYERLG